MVVEVPRESPRKMKQRNLREEGGWSQGAPAQRMGFEGGVAVPGASERANEAGDLKSAGGKYG